MALPDTHPLADARHLSIAQFAEESFVSLPPREEAILPGRLRRLAHANGFVPEIIQVAPDTQTALAHVSAEVGCHLTLASVARNATDSPVVFVPIDETPLDADLSPLDVDLRVAWRRDDNTPALRVVLDEVLRLADDPGIF